MARVWVCASWPDPRSKGQGSVGHLELQTYCSAINVLSLIREIQPFLLLGWHSSSPFHGLNEPFWFKPAPEVKPEGVYWVQMAFATAQSCVWGALSWWRWMAQAEERSAVLAGEIFFWHGAHQKKRAVGTSWHSGQQSQGQRPDFTAS